MRVANTNKRSIHRGHIGFVMAPHIAGRGCYDPMSYEPVTEHIVRISQRGQITIPKKLRDRFGMHPDVEVEVVPTEDGLLIRERTNDIDPADGSDGVQADAAVDAADVERVLRERREQGLQPVDSIVGILKRPGWSTDEYMKEIRGR